MYRNEQQRKKKDDTCPVDFIIVMYDKDKALKKPSLLTHVGTGIFEGQI